MAVGSRETNQLENSGRDEFEMKVDIAIVGAGIMGLAHAVHAARAGLSIAVFERDAKARGASVRNFGMLAVVAQAPGAQLDDALRALACWRDVAGQAGIEVEQSGCLFLARETEEMSVLSEFASAAPKTGHNAKLVAAQDLDLYAPSLRADRVIGGLWSPDAFKVDQRQAPAKIADWLERECGVAFHFSTEVRSFAAPYLETTTGPVEASHIILCSGDDFATLYPEAFSDTGISRCQLQMLRTRPQPKDWHLRPFVVGGLSMTRYSVFADCPSLPALAERQKQERAGYLEHGIHIIACQEIDGSITIGDSHAYGNAVSSERSEHVDRLIMEDLAGMISLPETEIAERWLGHYAHLPNTEKLVLPVTEGVTAVTMTNGQGMTHAFAVAEAVIQNLTTK